MGWGVRYGKIKVGGGMLHSYTNTHTHTHTYEVGSVGNCGCVWGCAEQLKVQGEG